MIRFKRKSGFLKGKHDNYYLFHICKAHLFNGKIYTFAQEIEIKN